ncbi:MAG TPA: hypothetical protein VNJ08_17915 [Bacteriovoracaceae bacterium]|nr:hypothetical protein [Bacteriovoracaceae bacterium]
MKLTLKFFFVLIASLSMALPVEALMIEENNLRFKPDMKALMKGDIQYSFNLLSAKELLGKFPEAVELDSLTALKEKKVKILMTKAIYVVDKPVGFFDHEHMKDENYIAHIMGDQEVKKLNSNTFKVTVPGESGHSYKMKTFFDSDDISTLPNPRTIRGVSAARKLDVISMSASSIVFKEFTAFSKYTVSGTTVHSYISLKEGKTLVISYRLMAVKKYYALDKLLKSNYLNETAALKTLIGSFQEK